MRSGPDEVVVHTRRDAGSEGELMAREVEAKFQVASEELFDGIRSAGTVAGYPMESSETVPQRDTYFDTDDATLLRAGWSLRLREKAGAVLVTFKGPFIDEHARTEFEEAITDEQAEALRAGKLSDVDTPAVVAALRHVESGHVHAVLCVDNVREAWYIDAPCGDGEGSDGRLGQVKLCFDRVAYTTGTDADAVSAREFELEIELQDGDEALLRKMAQSLAAEYDLSPQSQSKYQRGIELLGVFA
ncbi:CYTH domain-containing protein [Candidatus Poribacteria bacterium]|jgi:inorganic triphosphatase YgiF|nr:CYTH domain-containing protein [Candidatus Poribacteria bacterium]MBT5714821.1 CYTH domain-containing protein [Candidatus Poribacteria bacterium]MBT7095734.1 CYTH domain-containing protein [Candidatus Poribacteria bacterium]